MGSSTIDLLNFWYDIDVSFFEKTNLIAQKENFDLLFVFYILF